MAEEKTYLELSEDSGSSHKFYEVTVSGSSLTIRYGRIGDSGQIQKKDFPSPDKALAEAKKKIAEKTKKGYAPAVMGVRQKRSVTRREITSSRSSAKAAPVLWRFQTGTRAFGIFVGEDRIWVGNENGSVFELDHDGKVLSQTRLPDGVKCIVADAGFIYAGCDDGKVYDLSGKMPRVAYEIEANIDIFWLDIKDGVLGVSDRAGNVAVFNHEDESQWRKKSSGTDGWMVRCDEVGVYHGHSGGVTMYDWEDGERIWSKKTQGPVLFGWQEESTVFSSTSSGKIHRFTKKGEGEIVYACDAAVFSCAAAEDGKYVFGGDNCSSVYCFEGDGRRLWKLSTGCGSAYSMQFHKDRLYLVTTDGFLTAIDASEAAIKAAEQGSVPKAIELKAPAPVAVAVGGALEETRAVGKGVVVECYKDGGALRIRPVTAGFHAGWNVQFPKDIREAGARYVVEELREAGRGGFYRAHGTIRRLVG